MSQSHRFHPTILRAYDIRGIVGETLSAADARAIGRAFGTMLAQKGGRVVCVGYDGRLSSPELEAALVEGLVVTGMQVRRIGLGPTPMLYYAAKVSGADGGIMVTGSHNPPNHNGFKMVMGGKPFFGADIRRLGEIAAGGDFAEGKGEAVEESVAERYVERLVQDYRGKRDLKVVWDAGNGAAGAVLKQLTDRLPGRHTLLFADVDGTFPNHHPDPTEPKNLVKLQDTVLFEQADMGIAFDGDGDRIGVVDGQGRILWGDQLMVLLAEEVLADQPGATIIADIKASQTLFDEIERMGGTPLMWKTGHSLIKSKMAETGSPLAGEMSGHIFFADRYYGYDDALYAAIRMMNVVASSEYESLAHRHDRLPHPVNTPELRFDCPEDRKFAVIEEVKARLKEQGADMVDIDGVRVRRPEGWWLLRASNTQAVLVARCEAKTAQGLKTMTALLEEQLAASGIAFQAA
ncbi:phosphoglucomutase/phosphomannomutase PgmG [Telmatospirillum sp. J64-1]|uniref:phosphoglucomutase/phosphomannomutase PgmG n=1 Tax=Telmatospirillum sp. J64-1 TaxID=2502183 RepID=UPI00115C5D20|nr:phosphomannomutase/phosphoglucomutase [Telmatospirillum sp. J64-1]